MPADADPLDIADAPAESVDLWIQAVRRMDRDALESFVRRTWSSASLRPLAVVVEARRAELGRRSC
jgi:hypothetical protein